MVGKDLPRAGIVEVSAPAAFLSFTKPKSGDERVRHSGIYGLGWWAFGNNSKCNGLAE